ncbi:MAG: demethoxyubiquinone hydroxylase family protein [Rhodovibrionaceae bacterium]|nr:demethoxyubiquinone hydroxylase family protein [Rhodovibrionaceae bacterium]
MTKTDAKNAAGAGEPQNRRRRRLPGDPDRQGTVAQMVRVDHAGEYGARRIYEGQLAVLGRTPVAPTLRHMYEQELRHLQTFESLMVEKRVRPTVFQPLWHVAGFALGAATAMMGERAAMACTVAVEETIDEHYAGQIRDLEGEGEDDLRRTMEEFRQEELEHRDIGLEHEAEQTPGYELLSHAIKTGSRLAIWLSKRF